MDFKGIGSRINRWGGGRDITREFQMDITCADCLGNVEAEAKRLRLKN